MGRSKFSVRDLCFTGIFAAVITVASQLSVPMPYGVPMTLQTFVIPLAGIALGAKKGAIATFIYIGLGAAGIPVFAGYAGGMGIVLGPTGGFILSFPVMALLAGAGAKKDKMTWLASGLVAGAAFNYICGMLWFGFATSADLKTAFAACVMPFIPTAIVKIALAAVFGRQVRRALAKRFSPSPI